jgi:formate dehydrogenase subunit gamma
LEQPGAAVVQTQLAQNNMKGNGMTMLFACARFLLCAIVCALILAIAPTALPANAQQQPSPPQVTGQAPIIDPDARAVNEEQLLRGESRIQGLILIPNQTADVLIQPAGRTWRYFHEVLLHWGAAAVIVGTILLLAVGYWFMGRIRISAGRSGSKVHRFNAFERFSHWLTAVSFVVLALTGLNITFGKILLMPVIGPDAFSIFAEAAKYAHNFTGFAFAIGLVLIVALWVKDNIPRKVDIIWLKQGGGFIGSKHPQAGRFNAGEKLVFWFAVGGGTAVVVSGILLLFPFYITNVAGMQLAQVVHAVIAVLFIALILGHIYIGTLGMEGAFEAMATGSVDLNWAKEHHGLWLEEEIGKGRNPRPAPNISATPAE